jgi:hypothetical protein
MVAGTKLDLNVRNPFLHTALSERLTQFADAFNLASSGAIILRTEGMIGEAMHSTFFQNIAGLVTRRDTTSVAAAAGTKLTNQEKTIIKMDRKIGPVENTLSSFIKIGMTSNEMQTAVGEQAGVAMALDMLNDALGAIRAAMVNDGAVQATVAGPVTSASLIQALYKRGDRASDVVIWIMHSFAYSQLVQSQLAANIMGVSNFNVASGTPVTMGRPVIVTDSTALVIPNGAGAGNDYYYTLGLVAGSAECINSETENVVFDIVTGLENLVGRVQGEYAYSLGIRGYSYNLTVGGSNPASATLRTGTNWTNVIASFKDGPGVILRSQTT